MPARNGPTPIVGSPVSSPKRPLLSREEWLARREARREQQRKDSVERAVRMHHARMAQTCEAEQPRTKLASTCYVGCSGWFYWSWRSEFYPEGSQPSEWFDHYARTFNTVELNAPYYSWPTIAAVKAWRRQIGRSRFAYTVKVNELITHTRRFWRTAELVRDFGLIADLLGPSMGCFLFQFPASFKYSRARLDRIVAQLDPRHRNVVEFRHKSWWNNTVYESFREAGIIFCSCSGPRLPDELIVTAPDIYIRFHGTKRWYRHDYTRDELKVWAERVKRAKHQRVWAYFNNTNDGHAIRNAKTFRQLLRKAGPARAASSPSFDEASYEWKAGIDYRAHPDLYRVGKGEQGVLICEPYKGELLPLWRFRTPDLARKSSKAILARFKAYLADDDFVGADMARKFLQMGYTRSRRYANYKGGRKYGQGRNPLSRGTGDPAKTESAVIFYKAWKSAEANPVYGSQKKAWKKNAG
jgi:uncharacterized protein YecE (DUF72 family)